ncbi:hypothetical protein GCM10009554_29200 [Kribbella koreensis]|uniref:BNR/Asp-box repeat protein n=1 Tax=Kribbella koreensis TaxID=57909 RepID=A0ABP4AQE2_9ACTN
MSELKELSWEIQEDVQPLPFEQLERRGRRRRRRNQTLAGTGVAAAVTIAVLAALLPLRNVTGTEKPPVATQTVPIAVDKAAESLVGGHAKLSETVFASPTRWVASWDGSGEKQRYAAVLSRDGVRTTTPVRDMWFSALRIGGDPAAVSGPKGTGDKFDPSWAQTLLVRLTADGKVEKKLHWAAPTTTFGKNEVLTYDVIHDHVPLILDPDAGTLRRLVIDGTEYLSSPVQDGTGRWWLVGGKYEGTSYIFWTDDGGRTWGKTVMDPKSQAGDIHVSADGNTAVAYSTGGGAGSLLRVSTDRGATWTTVGPRERTWARGPVALNGGRVLLLEGELVLLGGDRLGTAPPKDSYELRGDDNLLYVTISRPDGTQQSIATSTDLGKTWKEFEPR